MLKKYFNSLPLWQFENLADSGDLLHFVTSRAGGSSKGDYKSFNLGLNAGDDDRVVTGNRKLLASALSTEIGNFITLSQIHSNKVIAIKSQDDLERIKEFENNQADAMVTDLADICPVVQVADCVPLLMYDPTRKVIAAVHAGWRGTVGRIARETVMVMKERFGCQADDILAGIGPSIGPCCYEVGEEVVEEVMNNLSNADKLLTNNSSGTQKHFNLWQANIQELMEAGLSEAKIETANICTCCNKDQFYSYRCQKGKTGRFWAGLMLKK
jgi:YfiH family protein